MNIYIGYVAFVRACQDKEGKILLTQSIKQVVQDDRLSYGDAEIVGNAQAAKQIQNVEVLYDLHGKAIRVELSLQLAVKNHTNPPHSKKKKKMSGRGGTRINIPSDSSNRVALSLSLYK